ncbi:MAG: peroxiredoxin [Aeoliella sp.]
MNSVKRLQLALFTLALLTPAAMAKVEKQGELKVGAEAPHFVGVDDKNKEWDSKEKSGKKIYVVYFYPADMTGGCTKQACAYRDAVKAMKRKDVEIVGVSGDSAENHQHFKNEYQLNFTLLADTDGKIADAFGVKRGQGGSIVRKIANKDVTLERGVTTSRWTFVIDKDWRIAHKDTKVKPAQDSANVLKVIEKLE